MVKNQIKDQFGTELTEVFGGRLLRVMGLTPQRSQHRAYQQNQARVADWLETEHLAIQREAKSPGTTIYFGDEAGVRSDYHSGTT
jgi:hypothetical protein